MHQAGSFTRVRVTFIALALALPLAIGRAQAPAPESRAQLHSLGVGVAQLSANGSSSTGWTIYYTGAMLGRFIYDTQLAIFTENGAQSSAAQLTAAYGFGPYLKPELSAKQRRTAFFVGGGVWYSDASTDPMAIVGGIAPLGPLMVRLGYGLVVAKEANVGVLNLGVGFAFGQRK